MGLDSSSPAYAGGNFAYRETGAWTADTGSDVLFTELVEPAGGAVLTNLI